MKLDQLTSHTHHHEQNEFTFVGCLKLSFYLNCCSMISREIMHLQARVRNEQFILQPLSIKKINQRSSRMCFKRQIILKKHERHQIERHMPNCICHIKQPLSYLISFHSSPPDIHIFIYCAHRPSYMDIQIDRHLNRIDQLKLTNLSLRQN